MRKAVVIALWALLLLGAVLGYLAIFGIPIKSYKNEYLEAQIVYRLKDFIYVNSAPENVLRVKNHTYKGVRGLLPFYVEVPGTNLILFISDKLNGNAVFHFHNLASGEHFTIEGLSYYGDTLGSSGENKKDFLEWKDATHLLIYTKRWDRQDCQILDLQARKVSDYFNR